MRWRHAIDAFECVLHSHKTIQEKKKNLPLTVVMICKEFHVSDGNISIAVINSMKCSQENETQRRIRKQNIYILMNENVTVRKLNCM